MVSSLSYLLVGLQFLCIGSILITGPLLARNILCLGLELGALAIGLWAILAMRLGNFNVVPEVKDRATFVQGGPYKYIRHPMYTSVLMTTLALVLDELSWERALVWCALLIALLVKLSREEKLLTRRFPQYTAYTATTKKLIPFSY